MVAKKSTDYALVDIENAPGKYQPDSPIFHQEDPLDSPRATSSIFYFGDTFANIKVSVVLIFVQFFLYIISVWVVSPRGWIEPTGMSLMKIGAMIGPVAISCSLHGYVFELRRFVIAIFLHANIMHLLMNVLFQISLSPRFEIDLGSKKFAILFFSAGIVGNLVSGAFSFSSMSVGASTSCYGLLGAEYMREYLVWPSLSEQTKALTKSRLMIQSIMLIAWELINWSAVCHMGHLGGLIGGFCIYPFLCATDGPSPRNTWIRKAVFVGLGCVVSASFLVILIPATITWSHGHRECQAFQRIYFN